MKSKSQLHLNDRLVQTSLKILRLFLEESNKLQWQVEQTGLNQSRLEQKKMNRNRKIISKDVLSFGSNEIIKEVSTDRVYIIKVLKYLKKIHVIKDDENWKPGKKKRIKPTLLGLEIADIVDYMNKYTTTYLELAKILEDKVSTYYPRDKEDLDDKKNYSKQSKIDYKIDCNNTMNDNKYLTKKAIENIKYIDHISHALNSLEINEIYILISSYARIYYSYKEIMSSKTILFLKTIILEQINLQFNKWFNTIVNETLNSYTNLDEKEFEFKKIISRNLGSNYLEILAKDYSFDDEVEDRVKRAIVAMLKISKPIFPGETNPYSPDKDTLEVMQSMKEEQDLTKINFSKLSHVMKLIHLQNISESNDKKCQDFRKQLLN